MKKTHKIVMVASKEEAKLNSIIKRESDNRLATVNVLTVDDPNKHLHTTQHLYILSDDEIKEGDWCIGQSNLEKKIFKAEIVDQNIFNKEHGYFGKFQTRKIIGTTDKSLRYKDDENGNTKLPLDFNIPQLSELFIKIYIAEYNKGNIIKEIDLEMIFSHYTPESEQQYIQDLRENPSDLVSVYKPKFREDNTVIIDLVEEKKYTKEDILNFLCDNFLEIRNTIPDAKLAFRKEYFNDLIKNIE